MATEPWYCTREDVKRATDSKATARDDAHIDRVIAAGARAVEGCLHRRFYPWTGTRYFDWPNHQYAAPWVLRLDQHEVVSVTTLTAGGETIAPADYFLEPNGTGPPFTRIEIDLGSQAAFESGDTHQRSIAVTGVFGHSANEATAGALAGALDGSQTGVNVTNGALVGVGSILRCESERMIVTGRDWLDTGQNLGTNLGASTSETLVAVTGVFTGELILIDSEVMLVVGIAGSNALVRRAWDGSTLAAHTAPADVYASRTLTVERGSLGTTAASHLTATALVSHVVPPLVRDLAIAEAITIAQQDQAAWARTAGSGENERESAGRGVTTLRDLAYTTYGRKARLRAV